MKMLVKIKDWLLSRQGFPWFLLALTLISYGQILAMDVWKDDNAIFFKLTHIYERAGYFGIGILGQGSYKFSVAPYWFIYKLVGYGYIWAYYLLILFFYFLVVYTTYRVFSNLISPVGGKIAAFLVACGFVGSDGFLWLANAMLSDVSIIFDLLVLLGYALYFKKRRIVYYLFAAGLYWLVSFLAPLRGHYFVAIIILFEIVNLKFKVNKFVRSITRSLARLVPFAIIFYQYYIANLDSRTGAIGSYLSNLFKGNWYLTQGFFSSIAALTIPDWFVFWLYNHFSSRVLIVSIFLLFSLMCYLVFRKQKRGLAKAMLFAAMAIVWVIVVNRLFPTPVLVLTPVRLFLVKLGGLVLLAAIVIFLSLEKKTKTKFLFFFLWLCISVAVYIIYEPKAFMGTTYRYFTHSLIALSGVLAVIYSVLIRNKNFWSKFAASLIVLLGLLNLVSAVSYQNKIVKGRSIPVRKFYEQLESSLGKITVGDVIYFDVSKEMSQVFNDAFSVSSMPNETAIAWRYGVDRYDFHIFETFEDLANWLQENNLDQNQIHTFFYSNNVLTDTSKRTWTYLHEGIFENLQADIKEERGLVIIPKEPIETVTPLKIELTMSASPTQARSISFPFVSDDSLKENEIAQDPVKRTIAFNYAEEKKLLMSMAKVTTNSVWFEDGPGHLIDGDLESAWRAHRVLWSEEGTANLTLDLGKTMSVNKFVWFNAFSNHTPTKYKVELSTEGKEWLPVVEKDVTHRIEPKEIQVESFEPHTTRYIRMTILATLSGDSPGIAEVWVVPSKFKDLDIEAAEEFLASPFGFVPDSQSYLDTLANTNRVVKAKVYWMDNQSPEWKTSFESEIEMKYDFVNNKYLITIPARGTKLTAIKIANPEIPGELKILGIKYKHQSLEELVQE